jgi:GT2 family glycosyltransferase
MVEGSAEFERNSKGPAALRMPLELSIVIVTWNCRDFAVECLRSLSTLGDIPFEVIVVDNASSDDTVETIARLFPDVRLIKSASNLGFARANNLGIRASIGRRIALINPDVVLLDGCIARALDVMATEPSIGMLGPRMLGADGRTSRSGMSRPSLWNSLCDALVLHKIFAHSKLFGGQMMAHFSWDVRTDVDVLNGWFWLIRREALHDVGLLDEQFFMYGEDLDWCKRFRDKGWRIVFAPDAAAIHYGGGSSRTAPIRFYLEMQRANLQYWRKHHGLMARGCHIVIVAVHHAVRVAAYGPSFLLRRARDRSRQEKVTRSAACLRWLIWGRHRELAR